MGYSREAQEVKGEHYDSRNFRRYFVDPEKPTKCA
jgi:hypothetical protein